MRWFKRNTKSAKQDGANEGVIVGTIKVKKPLKLKALIGASLFVLLVAVGSSVYLLVNKSSNEKKILFTIGDKSYTEEDISTYIGGLKFKGVEGEDAIQAVRQALVFDYISTKYQIPASDDEIKTTVKQNANYQYEDLSNNPWAMLIGKRMVVEPKVRAMTDDSKKGYVFAFYFGSLVDTDINPEKSEKTKLLPGAGDPAKIQADKDYAKQKADEYRNDLKDKKIAPDDALAKIKSDKKLNPSYGNLGYSMKYGLDPRISWDQEVKLPPVVDYIKQSQLEAEKPSDIQTAKEHYMEKDSEYEAYYFFVYPASSNNNYSEIMKLLDEHGFNKISEVKQ